MFYCRHYGSIKWRKGKKKWKFKNQKVLKFGWGIRYSDWRNPTSRHVKSKQGEWEHMRRHCHLQEWGDGQLKHLLAWACGSESRSLGSWKVRHGGTHLYSQNGERGSWGGAGAGGSLQHDSHAALVTWGSGFKWEPAFQSKKGEDTQCWALASLPMCEPAHLPTHNHKCPHTYTHHYYQIVKRQRKF